MLLGKLMADEEAIREELQNVARELTDALTRKHPSVLLMTIVLHTESGFSYLSTNAPDSVAIDMLDAARRNVEAEPPDVDDDWQQKLGD